MATPTYLLLWDIDGTLVLSGGSGMRALQRALHKQFGISGLIDDIDFAGRTDRWIIRQIFAKFGITQTQEAVDAYLDAYLDILPEELGKGRAGVLPGVTELLLEASRRPGVTQALLTGNIRRGAETKLRFHALWDYFPFGAFADDSETRNELGPYALRRAHEHNGKPFEADRVWVIGDTPHDIACGKAIGAKTLAVATGSSSVDALAAHKPTAALKDFSDRAAFWAVIEGK